MIWGDLVDQASGAALMRWTVRVAVVCYLVRVAILLRKPRDVRLTPSTAECFFWLFGCGAYLAHVVCAFHFVHNWSHEAAYQHTAAETEMFIGFRRGEGIWANYLFTLIWVVDVFRIVNAKIRQRATTHWIDCGIQAWFAFIVVNATVVFGPPGYRILAIPVALILCWQYRIGQSRASEPTL